MLNYPPAPKEDFQLYLTAFKKFSEDNECDLTTLANAYDSCRTTDGYAIAKYLDRYCGWDIDSDWVEKLNDLGWLVDEELNKQNNETI